MKNLFNSLTTANVCALDYFVQCRRKSKKAQEYLEKRLSKEIIIKYKIGYAPAIGLAMWLCEEGISPFITKQLGLIKVNKKGKLCSMFKDRIMIPIIHADYVVGFGGRALSDEQPKYLNSKTSKIYQKKEILFNLHFARHHIDRLGYALLVEGYFDVLGLADVGVNNAVATCGTAFSIEQALLLKRYTNKVYTLFDGDDAGIVAAIKTKTVLKSVGLYRGRILLPNGHDPDTFVKKYGKKSLKKLNVVL